MRIIVNGVEAQWTEAEITYEDIVTMLLRPGQKNPPLLSVTYSWRGTGDLRREGTLSPGKSIEPAEGMIFGAYHTGNA